MNERLKSLEFQRLFQEYTFLGIDEEYKKEFITENSSKFNEAIKKLLLEEPALKDNIFPKNESNITEPQNIEPTESVDIKGLLNSPAPDFYSLEWLLNTKDYGEIVSYSASSESYDEKKEEYKEEKKTKEKTPENIEKAKSLFRKIAKKTHPDKTKTNQFSDFYIKAKAAYELCDILELYSICIKLGISYEIKDSEKEGISIKINMKKEDIKKIEMSYIWLWASSVDESYKSQLAKAFLIQEGHKYRSFFGM
jgi:hypothetical protein